jgi:lysozyme family protein
MSEKFEDIKIRKSKKDKQTAERKRILGQTTIYKTLHRKINIEQHKPH